MAVWCLLLNFFVGAVAAPSEMGEALVPESLGRSAPLASVLPRHSKPVAIDPTAADDDGYGYDDGSGSGSGKGIKTTPSGSTTTSTTTGEASNLPSSESLVFAIAAIPALVFGMTARKYIKPTLFLGAAITTAYLFYVFSPAVIELKNPPYVLPLISCGVGLVAGLISLKLLKLGLFCLGGCVGVLLGLAVLYSPLQDQAFFTEKPWAYDVWYGSWLFVFGLLATLFETMTIIFATAVIGSFVFALGIDYFVKTGFSSIIETVLIGHYHASTNAYYMIGGWVVLAIVSMIVQHKLGQKSKVSDGPNDDRRRRRRRSARARDERRSINSIGVPRDDWSEDRQRIHRKYGVHRKHRNADEARDGYGLGAPADLELDTAPLIPNSSGASWHESTTTTRDSSGTGGGSTSGGYGNPWHKNTEKELVPGVDYRTAGRPGNPWARHDDLSSSGDRSGEHLF